jgi:hypothetical protein
MRGPRPRTFAAGRADAFALVLGEREQCRGNFDPRARLHAFEVFARWRFRSRTPGPPPFSSMRTIPAVSSARLITSRVARRGSWTPSSRLRTVTMPRPA